MSCAPIKLPNGANLVRVYKPKLETDVDVIHAPLFRLILRTLRDSEFRYGNLVFTTQEYNQPPLPTRQFLDDLTVYSKTVKGLTNGDTKPLCEFKKWPHQISCHRCILLDDDYLDSLGIKCSVKLDINLADPTLLRRIELWSWSVIMLKIRIEAGYRQIQLRNKTTQIIKKLRVAQIELEESSGWLI